MNNYQHIIESLKFNMGSKGVFDVTVDGDTLYSKYAEDRHAEPGEVLELFTAQYADGVRRYGEEG